MGRLVFRRGVPGDRISGMKLKSRRTWWVVGILVVVFIPASLAVFRHLEQRHIEYVERLGGSAVRGSPLPWWVVLFYLPQQVHPFIPEGPVESVSFPFESGLTDAEIMPILGYFPSLVRLDLSTTRITDETLKIVSRHSRLEVIDLRGTLVTDEGVRMLSKSKSLIEVSLDGTGISDEAIVHLSKMRQLRRLSAEDTSLTDQSVENLCAMPKLYSLNVIGAQFSREGKRRLRDSIEQALY